MPAHLLIRMLAHGVERHMRERLVPLLSVGEEKQEGAAGPVGPAERSEAGKRKDTTRRTLEGDHPPDSLEDLLESLEGVTAAELRMDALAEHRVVGGEDAEAMVGAGVPLVGNQTAPGSPMGGGACVRAPGSGPKPPGKCACGHWCSRPHFEQTILSPAGDENGQQDLMWILQPATPESTEEGMTGP